MDKTGTFIIDVHVHGIPPGLITAIRNDRFPNVRTTPQGDRWIFSFPGLAASPPSHPVFTNFPLLASKSKEMGINYQLIGPWTDLFGYTLPPKEGAAWARYYNESLVSSCDEQSGMIPIATIPLQSSEYAISELKAAKEMGCKGVEIGTDIPGIEIDSPELENVWATIESLAMPVLLHPTFQVIPDRLCRQGLKNTVGRAAETTIALTLLLYSGVLIKHPGLVIIAAHGGGSFIWLIDRILRNAELGFAKTEGDLATSLKQLFFDSVVLNPVCLQFLIERVGALHVLLGSDSPYQWEPHPVETVVQTHLSVFEKEAILGTTASQLFDIAGQ